MGLFAQRAAGWQRFLTAYYVSAILTIASYWLTRHWFLTTGGDSRYTHVFRVDALLSKERFALSLLGVALASKYYRRQSIDSFLSDALTYCKSAVVLMVWYIDWRICVLYVLVLLVSYLLFPQPIYRGASAIEQFTPASFHQLVVDSPQPADVSWLVEFYAPWAPPCIHLEPVFAELSLKYTTERLRFGKVDASRWPQLAKQHRVSAYGTLPQLPTFVLYQHGKEQGRIPHLFEDGHVASMKIRREDLLTAFGLDEFLEEAKQKGRAQGGKAGSGGSAKKRR